MLIEGLKFDLRIYVLLSGSEPLRLYVYEEGLVRLATQAYQTPTA
jgi:tubulin polyglutamylase TTLL6/13